MKKNEFTNTKDINGYSLWVIVNNIIRLFDVGDVIDIKHLLDKMKVSYEYGNLMSVKGFLVKHNYVISEQTYKLRIKEIPTYGLTSGNRVGRTKIDTDIECSKNISFQYIVRYIPENKIVAKTKMRTDSDVFPERMSKKETEKKDLVGKAMETNSTQQYKEKLGHIDEMGVELGITLRCRNVKENKRGDITDFDFSNAEISISRLVIDKTKYDK